MKLRSQCSSNTTLCAAICAPRQSQEQLTNTEVDPSNKKSRLFSLARRSRGISLFVAALLWICLAIPSATLYAQDFRASISGQVADSTGAMIPGATITAVKADTGVSSSTKSGKKGSYTLLYLLPGQYKVTVEAANFQTMVYNNVVLDSSEQKGLNVTLKPGSVAQEVVVTADSVDLDTVSASTGGVVDQLKVDNMPSTGMDVFNDVVFTEGIRTDSTNTFNLTIRNNSDLYAVAGAPTNASTFYVNGAPMSDQNSNGTWRFVPNQNAVQQVQSSVMPYDAQYGRTGAGVFNANIKDGTNAYHGAVYDYYGNAFLNANTWLASLSHIRKSINIRNTFGALVGGPIRKDKTFFFASYEGYRQDQPTVITESVPLLPWLTGNFAGSGFTVYDPMTTHCVKKNSGGGCTLYGRNEFPNDQIPTSRFSPIGKAILAMFPAPNKPGYINNYTVVRPTTYMYDQYIGRVDQNFSEKTRLYALGTLQNNGIANGGNTFNNAASTAVIGPGRDYNVILDLTHVVSPSMVLDLKASYSHSVGTQTTGTALQNNYLASNLGFNMPVVGSTSHQNIVPQMNIVGMAPLFGNTQAGGAGADADVAGSATQLIGRHSLHYGGEFLDTQSAPTGIPGLPNGEFTFTNGFTQQDPYRPKTGQGQEVADALLGYPAGGGLSWVSKTFVVMHYYGLFLQDNFKVRSNLSLNLGLRWDVNMSPSDRHNRINAGFCLTCTNPYSGLVHYGVAPGLQGPMLGGLLFAGVNGVSSSPFQVFWNDWQPRVGFSWAVSPNTIVRGGYGVFDASPSSRTDSIGFSQSTAFVGSLDGNLTPSPYFNSGTPYPSGAIAPTGAAAGLETQAGVGITYNNTNRRIQMTQHWSLGVQRELPGSLLLDVQYMGTVVHRIPVATSLGVITTAQQQACFAGGSVCNNNVANPFHGVLAANTALGASPTIPAWQLMRAYPLFNGVTENSVPSGDSHFNSLNVRVERRLSSLDFVFNYEYSNWIDRTSYLNNGAFRDANLWKGLDSSDVRNYLNANVVYPLPSSKKGGFVGALANGWLFDSTVIWETGSPLALPSANFNCASYAPTGGQTRAHWFNNDQSCWSNLLPWQPRTTPLWIGHLRNPGSVLWNPAFHKQFALPREGMFAQFRMEALNGANHPTWGAPNLNLGALTQFSPTTSWTGFGTLPTTSDRVPRSIIVSLRILF